MAERNSVPGTAEELYKMLLESSDLAGELELEGEAVFWTFKNFWVYASLDGNEIYRGKQEEEALVAKRSISALAPGEG